MIPDAIFINLSRHVSRRDATRFNRRSQKIITAVVRLPHPYITYTCRSVDRFLKPAANHPSKPIVQTMSNQHQQKITDFLTWFTQNGGTWSNAIRLQHGRLSAHSLLLSTARA
jgi:hypothetical protein